MKPLLFCIKQFESQEIRTLYIQTSKDQFDKRWLELSRQIQPSLSNKGRNSSVEIEDLRAFAPSICHSQTMAGEYNSSQIACLDGDKRLDTD